MTSLLQEHDLLFFADFFQPVQYFSPIIQSWKKNFSTIEGSWKKNYSRVLNIFLDDVIEEKNSSILINDISA